MDVIREAYGAILGGGYSGIAKIAAVVGCRYYWPKLMDSVAEWIAGCDVCYRIKHKNARPYGLLQALPIPLERVEQVNIDFVTKLPMSEAGYDAVATTIDVTLSRVQAYWRVSYKCMFAHGGTLPDSSVPKQHLTGTAPCRRTAGRLAERCTPPKAEG